MPRTSLAVVLAVISATSARAADAVDVRLPAARYAAMPESVIGARVAPDGRIWWQVRPPRGLAPPKVEQIKDMLAKEFLSDSPQLTWASIVHIDPAPSARVWAVYGYYGEVDPEGTSVLLGYDGKTWATRGRPGRTAFTQTVRGETLRPVSAGGVTFFPGATSTERFDGSEWAVDEFPAAGLAVAGPATLTVEPDGKGALAAVPYTRANGGRCTLLWRFRNGAWARLPGITEEAALAIRSVAGGKEGAWALVSEPLPNGTTSARVMYVPYVETPLAQLVARLRAPEFATREAATVELLHRDGALKAVSDALADAGEDDVKYRLEVIRTRLERSTGLTMSNAGLFEIASPRQLITANDGRTFLRAQIATGAEKGTSLVLLLEGDGQWRRILHGDAETRLWSTTGTLVTEPIFADAGKRVWLHDGAGPACLLDLETKSITHSFHAAWGDRFLGIAGGRLLVAGAGPSVRVFAPEQKEVRTPLPPGETIAAGTYGISADGVLWAADAKRGLLRLETSAAKAVWTASPRLETVRPASTILAGRGDVLLCDSSGWALVTRQHVKTSPQIDTLIAENAPDIAAAFSGPRPFRAGEAATIVADKAGQIWLLRGREFKVLVDGKWIDAATPLLRVAAGRPYQLAWVGDGSRVYVLCTNPTTGQYAGVLAHVEGGVVVGKRIMPPVGAAGVSSYLYEKDGSLWVDATEAGRPVAIRLTADGVAEKVPDVAPILVDASGRLWVRPVQRTADTPALAVRRSGTLDPLPDLPPTGVRRFLPLGENRVGVWTELGLQMLVADASGKYSLGANLVPPMEWQPAGVESLGRWLILSGPRIDAVENAIQATEVK